MDHWKLKYNICIHFSTKSLPKMKAFLAISVLIEFILETDEYDWLMYRVSLYLKSFDGPSWLHFQQLDDPELSNKWSTWNLYKRDHNFWSIVSLLNRFKTASPPVIGPSLTSLRAHQILNQAWFQSQIENNLQRESMTSPMKSLAQKLYPLFLMQIFWESIIVLSHDKLDS